MRSTLIAGISVLALSACASLDTETELTETPETVEEVVAELTPDEHVSAPLIDRAAIFGNPERT